MNNTEIEKEWNKFCIQLHGDGLKESDLFIKDFWLEKLHQATADENKEWRAGRRCAICGRPKSINLAEMCADCFKNE